MIRGPHSHFHQNFPCCSRDASQSSWLVAWEISSDQYFLTTQLFSWCQRQVNHRMTKTILWLHRVRASLRMSSVGTWIRPWHDSCEWYHLANCALQGYYAASTCNSLLMFWDTLSVPFPQGSRIILFLRLLYKILSTAIDQNSCLCEHNHAATAESSLCSIRHINLANQCYHSSDYSLYMFFNRTQAGAVMTVHCVGVEQRKKPRPIFSVSVKLWHHSDMRIWAPSSWSQRTLIVLFWGHLELYQSNGTPIKWYGAQRTS